MTPFQRPVAIALSLILALAARPALAERIVSPEEFAETVTGLTFHFDRFGAPFGSEQYFEDRRVIWAFEGGECQRGIWFANVDDEICFVYDNDPTPQCWDFLEMPSGDFHARSVGSDPSEDLVTREITREPLDCPLPDLGV
jgi:hypothetical protein